MKFSTLPPASQRFTEINRLNLQQQWFFQSSKKVFKAQTLLACPKSGQQNCDDQTAVSAYKANSVISVQCWTYPAEPCSLEQSLERASNPTFYFELKSKHRRMVVKCVNLTRKFLASTLNQITSRFGCYSEEPKVKVTFPYFQKWHFWCFCGSNIPPCGWKWPDTLSHWKAFISSFGFLRSILGLVFPPKNWT